MSEVKCVCHINGYQIKDSTARADIETLKTDLDNKYSKYEATESSRMGDYIPTSYVSGGAVRTVNHYLLSNSTNGIAPSNIAKYENPGQSLGLVTPTGTLLVADPTSDYHAANKKYVDEQLLSIDHSTYVDLTSEQYITGHKIFNAPVEFNSTITPNNPFNYPSDMLMIASVPNGVISLPNKSGTIALTSDIPAGVSVTYDEENEALTIG